MQRFSVVIPTYTGIQTINQTLSSLVKQADSKVDYEVIVVIDGPNQDLYKLLDVEKKRFTKRNINFAIRQFGKNEGRFEARMVGAKLSGTNYLLFVDDRVQLAEDFFSHLRQLNERVVMPAVVELSSNNVISMTMNLIRRRLYGNKWGLNFKDYYIDKSNFESSPKGTTCLWVDKNIFLDACLKVEKNRKGNNRFVNEDTRILREIVEAGTKILRTAKLTIYYKPRDDFGSALKHLYERGPRFVDYYRRPGTRFFPLLLFIFLLPVSLVLIAILSPAILYGIAFGTLTLIVLIGLFISGNVKEFIASMIGLSLIGLSFSLGVWKGMLSIWKGQLRR